MKLYTQEMLVLLTWISYQRACKIKKGKKKTENTTKQYTAEQEPKDLHGSTICLHPRESAAPHHHIDHEIISSIQVAASFDLSWFLF